jgi:hypothetical protein
MSGPGISQLKIKPFLLKFVVDFLSFCCKQKYRDAVENRTKRFMESRKPLIP